MEFLKTHRYTLGLIAILGGALSVLHWAILAKFNWIVLDMDQAFMWYAVDEMREGRFHMLRYWGQDYGSMLEAWIALPFTFITHNKLLPLAAYFLLFLPYFLMTFQAKAAKRPWTVLLILGFIALMPVEYIMMGAMPRDMGSGIAVASIALLFTRSRHPLGLFFVGFFCLLGWSFNANAALLGALITVYVLCAERNRKWQSWLGVSLGYLAGYAIHAGVDQYYLLHPELIVQNKWPMVWSFDRMMDGIFNLSEHWGWLTPWAEGQGPVLFIFFAAATMLAWIARKWNVFIALKVFFALTIFSLGMEKVHDGIDSVFFSHERMYMALPPALLLSLIWLRPQKGWVFMVALLGFVHAIDARQHIEEKVSEVRNPHRDTYLIVMDLEQMTWRCDGLEDYWNETNAEAIFFGPGGVLGHWLLARGCPCLTDIEKAVGPDYERKTWELRALDQPTYSSFLWMSPQVNDSLLQSLNVEFRRIDSTEGYGNIYQIHGSNLNPMEIYKKAGFETVNY